MKDFSLSSLLRYAFPSLAVYVCLYIADRDLAVKLFEPLGSSLQVLAIFAFVFSGSIIYFFYRSIFYNHAIIFLQDWYRNWRGQNNYRTYFRTRYSLDTIEAQQIYYQIKAEYLQGKYSEAMMEVASGIHLTYIAGIIALIFSVGTFFVPEFATEWGFFVAGLILFGAAFLLDMSYEDTELRFILSLEEGKLDSYVRLLLQRLRSFPASTSTRDTQKQP